MSDLNARSVWMAVSGRLQLCMPREQHHAFVSPCVGYEWEGGDLVVAAASSYDVSWLELSLHLEMAREALAMTIGRNARILYRAMPGVAGATVRPGVAVAIASEQSDPDQCPNHPEAYLRHRTKLPSLRRTADRNGDEVFYCVGDSGLCTWVYSHQAGVFIRPGMERQTPLDMLRAYEQARKELRQRDRLPAGVV